MNLKQLYQTNSASYIAAVKMTPKGIMWHSTGANNPNLKRYVGPDDGLLGVNANKNYGSGGVHAFIGKLKDGSIATYQTLPWNYQGRHSGAGPNGQANKLGYIGFEICEDDLKNKTYFDQVYQEAVEFSVYLCKMFNLNPAQDGVIICHSEGCQRGIASNHADVMHWFPKYGKSMDTARADIIKLLKASEMPPSAEDATLVRIARTVAAESRGEPYEGQIAVAQCIYDRMNDKQKRFGTTLDYILREGQFAKPWDGDLAKTRSLEATKDVFRNNKKAFNQPTFYFLGKSASAATVLNRNDKYIFLGKIGNQSFWGDVKGSFKPYLISLTNVNVRKEPKLTASVAGTIKIGLFTIVEESNGWGKLKSGAGWVKLDKTDTIKK